MNQDDRLNLRARQMMDDATLPERLKLPNAGILLNQLRINIASRSTTLAGS